MSAKIIGKIKKLKEMFELNPSELGPPYIKVLELEMEDVTTQLVDSTEIPIGNCNILITPTFAIETKFQNEIPQEASYCCPSCEGKMLLDFSQEIDNYVYVCADCEYTEEIRQ